MRIITAVLQDNCENTIRESLQCSEYHVSYTADAPQKAINKTAEGKVLLPGRQGRSWELLVIQTILAASLLCTPSWVFLCIPCLQPSVSLIAHTSPEEKMRNIESWASKKRFWFYWFCVMVGGGGPENLYLYHKFFWFQTRMKAPPPCDHRVTDFVSGDMMWSCWPIWHHTDTSTLLVLRLEQD